MNYVAENMTEDTLCENLTPMHSTDKIATENIQTAKHVSSVNGFSKNEAVTGSPTPQAVKDLCFIKTFENYNRSDPTGNNGTVHKLNDTDSLLFERASGTIVGSVREESYDDSESEHVNVGTATSKQLKSRVQCFVQITVPEYPAMVVTLVNATDEPLMYSEMYIHDFGFVEHRVELKDYFVNMEMGDTFMSVSNSVLVGLTFSKSALSITIQFNAVAVNSNQLEIHQATEMAGFVQTPSFVPGHLNMLYFRYARPSARLTVPTAHVIMISFSEQAIKNCMTLSTLETATRELLSTTYCCQPPPLPAIYNTSVLSVTLFSSYNHVECRVVPEVCCLYKSMHAFQIAPGFRMLYSFHKDPDVLQQLPDGKWNCSLPHWPDFQRHLQCNLLRQCQDGQDEVDCPYTTSYCQPGAFLAGDACFFVANARPHGRQGIIYWQDGPTACAKEGGQMASLKTIERFTQAVNTLTSVRTPSHFFVTGLSTTKSNLPLWYRSLYQWEDDGVEFNRHMFEPIWLLGTHLLNCNFGIKSCTKLQEKPILIQFSTDNCGYFDFHTSSKLLTTKCLDNLLKFRHEAVLVLCETKKNYYTGTSLKFPTLSYNGWNFNNYSSCPAGHVTHRFLECDVRSSCWSREWNQCSAPMRSHRPMYACQNDVEFVPYTLVCDSRSDCSDRSDEIFCTYPRCSLSYFSCGNGQVLQ